jgi:hypothetical protein
MVGVSGMEVRSGRWRVEVVQDGEVGGLKAVKRVCRSRKNGLVMGIAYYGGWRGGAASDAEKAAVPCSNQLNGGQYSSGGNDCVSENYVSEACVVVVGARRGDGRRKQMGCTRA